MRQRIILLSVQVILKTETLGQMEADSPRLSAAVSDFMSALEVDGRMPSTRESYQRELLRLVATLSDVPAAKVSEDSLVRVIRDLGRDAKGRRRGTATTNRIKSIYRSFFGWCRRTGRIGQDPSRAIRLAPNRSQRTAAITLGEISTLLSAMRRSTDRNAARDTALFGVYAFTGLRRSEALQLRAKDYDRQRSVLRIRCSKGGRPTSRIVPARLADLLNEYAVRIAQSAPSKDDPMFPGRSSDRPLSPRGVQARFEFWKAKTGIREELTIHSFRAGYATVLHQSTGNIALVARALGHKNLGSTSRYVNLDDNDLRRVIADAFATTSVGPIAGRPDTRCAVGCSCP